MTRILYFAYGSNLYPPRLQKRVPSARPLGTAVLDCHSLRFHKRGKDRSGKCDAFYTGRDEDRVLGVVYEMVVWERVWLDLAEGLGFGYNLAHTELLCAGRDCKVFYYQADAGHIDAGLQPFGWYRDLVLHGCRHHGLPEDYTRLIEAVAAVADADGEREAFHRGLLREGGT